MAKIRQFIQSSPDFWVAAAPFLYFIIPLLQGRAIFWGLPSLQFIPWRHYAWTLLRDGIFPLWNPLNGMGTPLLANYQLALFYPPAFPLFLLDELWGVSGLAWGFTLLVPVHLGWGAVGMTRFLKELGVGSRGQFVAGLAFGMSGYLVARGSFFSIIWAAAWLPWVMCWVEKIIAASDRRQTWKAGLTLSLLIAMMLLAGHAQISWYSLLLAGLWLLFRTLQTGGTRLAVRKAGIFAAFGVLAVTMAGIQLVPTFEFLQQSPRSAAYGYDAAMVYSFSPLRLLGYLTPELFGNPGRGDFWGYASYWEDAVYIGLGVFVLASSTIGWLFLKRHRREPFRGMTIFLWSASIGGILLALGANTPIFPWLYQHFPTFDMFQGPARWMLWPTFSLAVLAGLAADRWKTPAKTSRVILNLAAFGGIILAFSAGAASLVLSKWEPGIFRGLIYFGLTMFATAFTARRVTADEPAGRWVLAAGVVIVLDLLAANALLNPTAPAGIWNSENSQLPEINHTRDGGRVWMEPNLEQIVKYTWFFQFDDFTNRTDWAALRSSNLANVNLLDGVPMINNFDPLVPARFATWKEKIADVTPAVRSRWLSRAGAGAEIIADPGGIMATTVVPIAADARFSWSSCAVKAATADDALTLLDSQMRQGESDCIILEGIESTGDSVAPGGEGRIQVVEDRPNHIVLSVESSKAGWLLVRDSWFPGWRASLDGLETTLYPADYLFKAVPVPAGKHHIALEYKPDSFTIGLIASLLSWLFWGAAWFISRRR